ncbi:hypothetical protein PHLCEN_2v8105 [Hermanssonia centrifuga]|uniref:C2H2-type domain-containing protein n=1 Tax=Hermanssonia centrifuga TaxID=98765 RepID=A0A2R6NUM6_9APHY|nr:hypothetical protein PHLCEN_2v8105 [Hermanssonia centrifuga]
MARPSSNVTLPVPQDYIVTGLLGLVRSQPFESGNATASCSTPNYLEIFNEFCHGGDYICPNFLATDSAFSPPVPLSTTSSPSLTLNQSTIPWTDTSEDCHNISSASDAVSVDGSLQGSLDLYAESPHSLLSVTGASNIPVYSTDTNSLPLCDFLTDVLGGVESGPASSPSQAPHRIPPSSVQGQVAPLSFGAPHAAQFIYHSLIHASDAAEHLAPLDADLNGLDYTSLSSEWHMLISRAESELEAMMYGTPQQEYISEPSGFQPNDTRSSAAQLCPTYVPPSLLINDLSSSSSVSESCFTNPAESLAFPIHLPSHRQFAKRGREEFESDLQEDVLPISKHGRCSSQHNTINTVSAPSSSRKRHRQECIPMISKYKRDQRRALRSASATQAPLGSFSGLHDTNSGTLDPRVVYSSKTQGKRRQMESDDEADQDHLVNRSNINYPAGIQPPQILPLLHLASSVLDSASIVSATPVGSSSGIHEDCTADTVFEERYLAPLSSNPIEHGKAMLYNGHDLTATPSRPPICPSIPSPISKKRRSHTPTGTPRFHCTHRLEDGSLCDKGFTRAADLTRHVRSTHAHELWPCPGCNANFTRSDALKRHLQKPSIEDAEYVRAAKEIYGEYDWWIRTMVASEAIAASKASPSNRV